MTRTRPPAQRLLALGRIQHTGVNHVDPDECRRRESKDSCPQALIQAGPTMASTVGVASARRKATSRITTLSRCMRSTKTRCNSPRMTRCRRCRRLRASLSQPRPVHEPSAATDGRRDHDARNIAGAETVSPPRRRPEDRRTPTAGAYAPYGEQSCDASGSLRSPVARCRRQHRQSAGFR